jgi:uncharacterized protein
MAVVAAEGDAGAAVAVEGLARNPKDRVGIGWRGMLAASIFANLDQIDLIEIIADDHFDASSKTLRALRTLSDQVPITLHGVTMGLASMIPVDLSRAENMARLVNTLEPESWSEHMAFVRGGGIEIGHLAAPPRTQQSMDATVANIERVSRIVGAVPQMENIATLIYPPTSTVDETTWVSGIVDGSGCGLLLDLHNLHANALNFGGAAEDLLLQLPLHKVSVIHISGGQWAAEPGGDRPPRMRLVDDHLHDPPPIVYSLLTMAATHATQPLSVILERDGDYPHFGALLNQLDSARVALRRGRDIASRTSEAA